MCYIDKSIAMNYLMGNEFIFSKVKNSFIANYQNYHLKEQEFNERKYVKEIYFYIHSIKGISLNLGALQLYNVANDCLDLLKKELWSQDQIDHFFKTLDKTYWELKSL